MSEDGEKKRPTYQIVCANCGKVFEASATSYRFCSDACRFAYSHANYMRQCDFCGKIYHPQGSEKYCCEDCRRRARVASHVVEQETHYAHRNRKPDKDETREEYRSRSAEAREIIERKRYCLGCIHFSKPPAARGHVEKNINHILLRGTCDYILHTGKSRPCMYGTGCTEKVEGPPWNVTHRSRSAFDPPLY